MVKKWENFTSTILIDKSLLYSSCSLTNVIVSTISFWTVTQINKIVLVLSFSFVFNNEAGAQIFGFVSDLACNIVW